MGYKRKMISVLLVDSKKNISQYMLSQNDIDNGHFKHICYSEHPEQVNKIATWTLRHKRNSNVVHFIDLYAKTKEKMNCSMVQNTIVNFLCPKNIGNNIEDNVCCFDTRLIQTLITKERIQCIMIYMLTVGNIFVMNIKCLYNIIFFLLYHCFSSKYSK